MLGAELLLEQGNTIGEDVRREVFELAIFVATGLHDFLFIIEAEAKHLVMFAANGKARVHELFHFLAGEQQCAVFVPIGTDLRCP
jgi:hypothetical protein